jgi:hypothetical protein
VWTLQPRWLKDETWIPAAAAAAAWQLAATSTSGHSHQWVLVAPAGTPLTVQTLPSLHLKVGDRLLLASMSSQSSAKIQGPAREWSSFRSLFKRAAAVSVLALPRGFGGAAWLALSLSIK